MSGRPQREANRRRRILVDLIEAQGGYCAGCGLRIPQLGDLCLDQDRPSVDHVIARASGGGDHKLNMLAMHSRCNSAKGDRPPNGCELIWHELVLAKFGMGRFDYDPSPSGRVTLAEVWPV